VLLDVLPKTSRPHRGRLLHHAWLPQVGLEEGGAGWLQGELPRPLPEELMTARGEVPTWVAGLPRPRTREEARVLKPKLPRPPKGVLQPLLQVLQPRLLRRTWGEGSGECRCAGSDDAET
jgi:hypothetical protein